MLIGLNGFKSAGKDTVGDYLVEQYDFTKVSFAALLKQSAAALFKVDAAIWDTNKNDPLATVTLSDPNNFFTVSMTVREFLQRYGTESHRDVFGFDFWVDQAFNGLNPTAYARYVFTDARFDNELQAIREKGGVNFQIQRKETDKDSGGHASEVRPNPNLIDYVLSNNGTKEQLYSQVDKAVEKLYSGVTV